MEVSETASWLLFGIVAVIALAVTATKIAMLSITTSSEEWIACIEIGRSMVNGVCL